MALVTVTVLQRAFPESVAACDGGVVNLSSDKRDISPRQNLTPLMSRRFLRQRAELAREAGDRNVETAVRQVANLTLNASALADRMEAQPVKDLQEARERRARVSILRDAVRDGQEAIRRATADLVGDQEDEVCLDRR